MDRSGRALCWLVLAGCAPATVPAPAADPSRAGVDAPSARADAPLATADAAVIDSSGVDAAASDGPGEAPPVPAGAPPLHCFPVAPAGGTMPALLGPLYLQNVANGQVVDLQGGDARAGHAIVEWGQTSAAHQRWWFEQQADGYRIKSDVNGSFCLGRAADQAGAAIQLADCGSPRTGWSFESLGEGQYRLKVPGAAPYLHVLDEKVMSGRALVLGERTTAGAGWLLVDQRFRACGVASADPTLDQWTFLTAHNAFYNSQEVNGARFANQSQSIARQLEGGVRGLQLDIWLDGNQVRQCHGACQDVLPFYSSRGPLLGKTLTDVVAFLERNPTEVVTLFLEDYIDDPQDLRRVIEGVAGLRPLLFDPRGAGVLGQGWPTLSELRRLGRRLLIFSQRGGREDFGVMHDRDYTVENHWQIGSWSNPNVDLQCRSRWDGIPLHARGNQRFRPLHVMNHYRDAGLESNADTDNRASLRRRATEICAQAAGRKPNYVAVDMYDRGEARQLVDELNRPDPQCCRWP